MIYEISNGELSVGISTAGAQLMSVMKANGFEYLWQGNPEFWSGRAPVLFPFVGALRDNKAQIKGKQVEIGRHGFARKREFDVVEHSSDKIVMRLEADEKSKEIYPFDFSFEVSYTVEGNKLTTEFRVKNMGDEDLPFCVGGHPAYNIPVDENADFEDYTIVFEKKENQRCPKIELGSCLINEEEISYEFIDKNEIPLEHSLFYEDALVFENLNSETVSVINKDSGHGFCMDISQFPMLGIWSAQNNGPYVALEPWTGCATLTTEDDVFESKKNMTFLPKGKDSVFSFSVRFLG